MSSGSYDVCWYMQICYAGCATSSLYSDHWSVAVVLTETVGIGGRQVYQFKTPTKSKSKQMVQKGKDHDQVVT